MSKQIYQNKILLNIDNATMEMIREIAKKNKKPEEKRLNVCRTIRDLLNRVIHS
jgi:hypothetical protein